MSTGDLIARARAVERPSTAPVGLQANQQWERGEGELIAVPIAGSELLLPRSSFPPENNNTKGATLPSVAPGPVEIHSSDRFLDECVPPSSVPRSRRAVKLAMADSTQIYKMFHDFILALFYGDDSGESQLPVYKQKELRLRRHARRKNTRYIYLLEKIIPLVSQGLTELTHATIHRQKHLRKILPQCFVEESSSGTFAEDDESNATGMSGDSFIQPPGGALVWLARYMIRNNPKNSAKYLNFAPEQHRYAAIFARTLREYDYWQTCKEQHAALKRVDLQKVWDSIDTNEDGTLDVSEVGKALTQLGFKLRSENGVAEADDTLEEESWTLKLADMEQFFSALDVDGSGDIDFDEFVLGTTEWFSGRERMARALFDRNIDSYHQEHSDDMAVLLQSLARQRMIRSIQSARLDSAKLFSKIDTDGTGFVDHTAFQKGILELASVMYGGVDGAVSANTDDTTSAKHDIMVLSRNSLRLFAEIDTNGDGLISLEEFQKFFVGYIDASIEEKAQQAASRIEKEQEAQICAITERGNRVLGAADRALAVQQIRLDALQRGDRSDGGNKKEEEGKASADLLAQLREGISRLKFELGPDCENQRGLEILTMAEKHLSVCMETLQNAEKICRIISSDIECAQDAITAALKQATPAARLARIQSAVQNHSIVEAYELAIQNLTEVISVAEETICSSSAILLNLKNAIAGAALHRQQVAQRRAIEERRRNRQENERRKAEEAAQRHRREAAEKFRAAQIEESRRHALEEKAQQEEILRKRNEESAAAVEDARQRECEAAQRELDLRARAQKTAEERRLMRLEIERAKFAKQRMDEEKAREEKYREEEALREAQKLVENFQPQSSVFQGRGRGAHAAFFNSDKTCREAVEYELERALAKASVESLINHPDQEQVQEVKKALLGSDLYSGSTCRAILNIYRHYCLSGHHMFSMQKFGFDQFTQESGIADPTSSTCTPHHLETTFITSNLSAEPRWRSAAHSYHRRPDRSLSRAEFIEALIRLGIQKYYADDECNDQVFSTGQAVNSLVTRHIINFVHSHDNGQIIVDPDDFRKKVLYSHAIDTILRSGENIVFLQNVYQASGVEKEEGRLGVPTWLNFVRSISDIGTKADSNNSFEFSFHEMFAKECFMQSRLVVVDEEAPTAALRVRSLNFEDFLEAIVRLACGVKVNGKVVAKDADSVAQGLDILIQIIREQWTKRGKK